MTPLHLASDNGLTDVLELLLKSGVKVHALISVYTVNVCRCFMINRSVKVDGFSTFEVHLRAERKWFS